MTDIRQYGELATQLLMESRRSTQTDTLSKYNDSLVRTIIREQRDLERAAQALMREGAGPDPALLIIQTAINRNKRSLLAYHAHRIDRLRDMYWAVGGALPHILSNPDTRSRMSPHEVDYLRQYNSSVMEFRSEFTHELDITASITNPPKDLQVLVRVIRDCGVIQTELGSIDFRKDQRFMVRRSDIEHLIVQGYLEEFRFCPSSTPSMIPRPASSSASTSRLIKTALLASSSTTHHVATKAHSSSIRRTHTLLPRQSTSSIPRNNTSRQLSDLGVRSNVPPDSVPDPDKGVPPEIPDHEWELRTGRGIYVLQETLPDFFHSGLITSINKTTGAFRAASTTDILPTANSNFLEHHYIIEDDDEAVYSPNVRLTYTPPVALPAPFPKTFHVEGQQLYLASSSFLKHTMNALYSDLHVQIIKLVINTPPAPPSKAEGQPYSKKKRINREKTLQVRLIVTGVARVSGKQGEWDIDSTYTFSPLTGLIHEHTVNSIHPAPHQAVYDSLRLSFGWGTSAGGTPANGAACNGMAKTALSDS
ncbi:hypothetical protein CVT24_001636 [Panaeolus cyanescens]|uniref:DNA replication complex GINS protein PSF1 n=1 Tax=Panaeolus cyanescens TaxID=181874 RepID=A0A409VSU6_9AGAR|nr:hypothetical protein CVT24_001636 [Panaeolus cyanescens]